MKIIAATVLAVTAFAAGVVGVTSAVANDGSTHNTTDSASMLLTDFDCEGDHDCEIAVVAMQWRGIKTVGEAEALSAQNQRIIENTVAIMTGTGTIQ